MSQMIPLNLVLASILDTFGISVTSILLHLLNLVVLTVGLYFLLFKPVKRMVRERQEKVKKIEQENSELNAEVKKLKDNTEEVLTEAKKEAADIHEKAVRVANQKADDIIGEAKNQGERARGAHGKGTGRRAQKIAAGYRKGNYRRILCGRGKSTCARHHQRG